MSNANFISNSTETKFGIVNYSQQFCFVLINKFTCQVHQLQSSRQIFLSDILPKERTRLALNFDYNTRKQKTKDQIQLFVKSAHLWKPNDENDSILPKAKCPLTCKLLLFFVAFCYCIGGYMCIITTLMCTVQRCSYGGGPTNYPKKDLIPFVQWFVYGVSRCLCPLYMLSRFSLPFQEQLQKKCLYLTITLDI